MQDQLSLQTWTFGYEHFCNFSLGFRIARSILIIEILRIGRRHSAVTEGYDLKLAWLFLEIGLVKNIPDFGGDECHMVHWAVAAVLYLPDMTF